MSKAGSAAKVKLSSYDDLFGNAEEKTGSEEQIIRAKLTDLHEFRNHPFRVLDEMCIRDSCKRCVCRSQYHWRPFVFPRRKR